MPKILIIADDYTGANDTAVKAAQLGLTAFTILGEERGRFRQADCAAVSTDSRSVSPEDAYDAVKAACLKYITEDTLVLSKRIDSTLRGNLGAEIDGMLDAVGEEYTAIIVPTFPSAGRIYTDGCLRVNGIPLTKTAAADDPKNPVRTDSPSDLLSAQSRYGVSHIGISVLRQGETEVLKRLSDAKKKGDRLILFEAEDENDLSLIAHCVRKDGIPFICSDPGAFTCEVIRQTLVEKKQGKLLFLIGSVNDVTRKQVMMLENADDTAVIYAETEALLDEFPVPGKTGITDRILHEIGQALSEVHTVCLCTDGIFPENRIDPKAYAEKTGIGEEEISDRISRILASLAAAVVERHDEIRGLFACGGDTAAALCRELNCEGEYPLEEVIPLTVYGRLAGGKADSMPVITKGGMIGDEHTLIRCRDFLIGKEK